MGLADGEAWERENPPVPTGVVPRRITTAPAPPTKASALDVQVGGGHYKDFVIQPIEFITKNQLPFCEANVIKYVCRHKSKNGRQDLEKAKHYIEMLLELGYPAVTA